MKMFMFAVYDSCSKMYDRPFCGRSEGEAVRSFGDIASDADHPIGKHPEHFSLFEVGSYDDNTGVVVAVEPVRYIVSAHELVKAPVGVDKKFSSDGVTFSELDNDGYPHNGGLRNAT